MFPFHHARHPLYTIKKYKLHILNCTKYSENCSNRSVYCKLFRQVIIPASYYIIIIIMYPCNIITCVNGNDGTRLQRQRVEWEIVKRHKTTLDRFGKSPWQKKKLWIALVRVSDIKQLILDLVRVSDIKQLIVDLKTTRNIQKKRLVSVYWHFDLVKTNSLIYIEIYPSALKTNSWWPLEL